MRPRAASRDLQRQGLIDVRHQGAAVDAPGLGTGIYGSGGDRAWVGEPGHGGFRRQSTADGNVTRLPRRAVCASTRAARDEACVSERGDDLIEQNGCAGFWSRRRGSVFRVRCFRRRTKRACRRAGRGDFPGKLAQLIVLGNVDALSAELQADVSRRLYESEAALYDPVVFTLARYDDLPSRAVDDPLNSPFFGAQPEIEEEIGTVEVGSRCSSVRAVKRRCPISGASSARWPSGQSQEREHRDREPSAAAAEGSGALATEADCRSSSSAGHRRAAPRERLLEVAGDGVSAYWQLCGPLRVVRSGKNPWPPSRKCERT